MMVVAAGSAEPKALDGIEGKDITLPDKLMGTGALIWRSPPCELQTCLRVQDGDVMTISAKVSWNSYTGVIAVKHLQKNESSQLVLEIINSSNVTRIVYNLTVLTPPGNEQLWFLLLLVPVLVFAGLVCYCCCCKKGARFNLLSKNGGKPAAGPTMNGHEASPMMETEDSSV